MHASAKFKGRVSPNLHQQNVLIMLIVAELSITFIGKLSVQGGVPLMHTRPSSERLRGFSLVTC